MRRLLTGLTVSLAASALLMSSAQGSAVAVKVVTIPVPSDGNASVAHFVIQGKPKKGKKPKGRAPRPRLKVSKAPKGVVVAASYKRDSRNKHRWHATVAITNPKGGATRSTAAVDGGQVEVTVTPTGQFVLAIQKTEVATDVVFADAQPPILWIDAFCDPPGSTGDAFLFGPPPKNMPATKFLDASCDLAGDAPVSLEDMADLWLSALIADLDPFPGNPNEYVVRFRGVNTGTYNAVAAQFSNNAVTAQLPPPGQGGTFSGPSVSWGNGPQPFQEGQEYRGNVRLRSPLPPWVRGQRHPQADIHLIISDDGGNTWTKPHPAFFTP